jgi:ABC-type multidrug transport system ATPase subunit
MKISLQDCGKSFNRKWLFKDLNCTLEAGESWAFLGPNGSGKSTLCLLLAGQVWPTEGGINWEYNGKNIERNHIFSLIALASPAMELPEEFSLAEVIAMHGRVKPFSVADAQKELLELCGFAKGVLQKPILNFSSGMKQRVKLAIAAMSDTPLLLLDEPLTNLDKAGLDVYENIRKNYCTNRLVVVASNREDEYKNCSRSLRIMPDGSVALDQEFAGSL